MVSFVRLLGFTLAGMILGIILMHPFAMVAYTLGPQHPHGALDIWLWGRQAWSAFRGGMLAMAAAFAFMGGVAGLTFGSWFLQRQRLAAAQLESQRRLAALETLKELMVTLAHHIRNANLVIGGFSARLLRRGAAAELQEQLRLVQDASRRIEAVVAALESLKEISTTHYTRAGRELMIDLQQGLEAHLAVKADEKLHES